eukprot:7974570-Pyramimonas_sp.AAC.1
MWLPRASQRLWLRPNRAFHEALQSLSSRASQEPPRRPFGASQRPLRTPCGAPPEHLLSRAPLRPYQ